MRKFVTIIAIFCSYFSYSQCVQSTIDFSECDFNAIAHRGYSEFYPENTLLAIEEAFKRGIKYCEIDVAITADNKYVLHHDPYTISRTTNGTGIIADKTLAELRLLDAGFWKSSAFENTKIPTLVEALQVAQQYDAYLYLDIKNFDAQLLADVLEEANVDASRMLPAITTLANAEKFNTHCPNSSWVWFGAGPDDPIDNAWVKERTDLGCKFFESGDDEVLENPEWFNSILEMVHNNGAKFWAYTVNNEEIINSLAEMGVDGVETDRPYVAQLKSCGYNPVSTYPKKEINGYWDFESLNFESTGTGSMLKNLNTDPDSLQEITFGTTGQLGVPDINGQEAKVARIPAYNPINGLFAYDNFMMEDSGAVDYTYSVIMDIYIPAAYKGQYISLIQTSPDNWNDADFFISPDSMLGTFGDYHGEFRFDTWQRVIFVLNDNKVQKFIDGEFIGESIVEGSRWTAFNNMAYHGKHGILLFADDSNETAEIYISALQLRNYSIGANEAASLGKPKAAGIVTNAANLYSTGIENLESELIDWEQRIIFLKLKEGAETDNLNYKLKLSYGATSSIPEQGTLSFLNSSNQIEISAQDGTTKTWTICRQLAVKAKDDLETETLVIYPNPFNELVTIDLNGEANMYIYSIQGQCLIQTILYPGSNQMDLSALNAGTYLFKVILNSGEIKNKTLIKH